MMLKLCRTLLLLVSAVGTTTLAQPAPPKNLVYIEETSGNFDNNYCVGILLHTDLVLTSLRCENKFNQTGLAMVGLTDRSNPSESEFISVGEEISINSILPGALLVRLSRPAEIIQPVVFNTEPLSPGTAVYKAGFRTVYNGPINILAEQSFQVIPTTPACRSIVATYKNVDAIDLVTDRMICADNDGTVDDICVDDFGGVLYDADNRVVGFAQTNDSACRVDPSQLAEQALPSIYLSVASYASELQNIVCAYTGPATALPQYCVPTAPPTSSPAPTAIVLDPSEPPEQTWCFSSQSTVQVLHKGEIPMEKLEIGDQVLTSVDGETYSRVYSFGHKVDHQIVEYLQIFTSTNNADSSGKHKKKKPLEISAEHLLYVVKDGASHPNLVPAGDVVVGDAVLITSSSTTNQHHAKVQSIGKVPRRGAYAPITTSGDIVVNGIVASNYVTLPSTSRLQTRLSLEQQHWVQHAAYAPYRVYCQTIGNCQNETYHETTGLSAAVMWWMPLLGWLEQEEACPEVVLTMLVFGVTLAEHFRWMHLLAAAVGYYVLVWKSGGSSTRRHHCNHLSEPKIGNEATLVENKVTPKAC